MKTNLAKTFFTAAAAHCLSESKHRGEMAKAHGAKMEDCEKESADYKFHKSVKEQHEGRAQAWAGMAQTCVDCAEQAGPEMMSRKAAGFGDDPDALVPLPEGLSTIAPTHVRAVSRFGQREIPREMDPAVAKVLGVGTDE